jgi:hypothetical protein
MEEYKIVMDWMAVFGVMIALFVLWVKTIN